MSTAKPLTLAIVLVGGALAAAAFGLRSAGRGQAPRSDRPPAPGDTAGATSPATTPGALSPADVAAARATLLDLCGGLARALEARDPPALRRAARELRQRLLAADAETIRRLASLLLDEAVDLDLRRTLALILGSLPGDLAPALVAEALARCAGPPELVRSLLLALGVLRDGPGAGLFDVEDQAHAVTDGPGLAPFIQGPIEDARVYRPALDRLEDPDVETRRTAARVLRQSLRVGDVREAFVERLREEEDDEAGGELGAAVGGAVLQLRREDPGRAQALGTLLAVAPKPGRHVTRFRVEGALGSVPLEREEALDLARLLDHPDPAVQCFALEVILRRLGGGVDQRSGAGPELEARTAGVLASASEWKVRQTAARVLGYAADVRSAVAALTRALREDPVSQVRAGAARALGHLSGRGFELSDPARAALAVGALDADEEVREAAEEAVRTIRPKR